MESLTSKENVEIPNTTTKFSDLPPEIIEKIFIYCCYPDIEKSRECIKTISLVCRRWLEITNTPTIHRKYFGLCLKKDDITNTDTEEIFRYSIRNFYNFNIKRINFSNDIIKDNLLKLLELHNLSKIETLSIWKCILDYDFLCEIIGKLGNLKELIIEGCRFPKEFSNTEENCKKIANIISKLNILKYVDNMDQCNLKFFNDFITHTKNLEYFKVEEYAVYDQQTLYTSELSMILYKLAQYNCKSLRKLKLFITCNSHKKLLSRYDLKSLNLELNSLSVQNIPVSLNLNKILLINSYLSELELIFSTQEDFFDFNIISENLKYVKLLTLSFGFLKNLNLFTLGKLKDLKKFTLKGCKYDFTTTDEIHQIENLVYLELAYSSVFFDDTSFTTLTENLTNLDILLIRNENINSNNIQAIIKNLTKLKVLSIVECDVTDYSISGFNDETNTQNGLAMENLINLEKLKINAKLLTELAIAKYMKFPNLKMLEMIDEDITETTVVEIIRNCPVLHLMIVSIKFDLQKCVEDLKKYGKIIEYDNEESHLEYHRYKIGNC